MDFYSLDSRGVELEIRAWVPSSSFLSGRTAVIEAAQVALREEGITVPLPQRVLWQGEPAPPT